MNRSTLIFLFACACVVFISSCKREKNGTLTVQFKAKYGNQDFALDSVNTDPQGRRIKIATLKFYLSDITLVKNDNSTQEIKDVALIDLHDPNSLTYNFENLKGDYKAIRFGCGVDSVQDAKTPADFDLSSPLSNTSMYWSWMKYVYEWFDGEADTTATGTTFPIGLTYHIGTVAMYRQTELQKSFSVCCDNNSTLTITLDIEKIFYGSQTLDIATQNYTMTSSPNDPIPPLFVNNFSAAFSAE